MEQTKIRLKESEKTKELCEELMALLIPSFSSNSGTFYKEYETNLSNYKLYNNVLETEEYNTFLNPLGINVNQVYNEIRPYNKAYQYIDVLIGEELKRGDSIRVILVGDKAVKNKNKELSEKYTQLIESEIELAINQVLMQNNKLPEEEIQKISEEIRSSITPTDININNYLSEMEIAMSKLLKYSMFSQDVAGKKNEGFFHCLISDIEVVYIGTQRGVPKIEVKNPLYTFFDKSNDVKYIQDGSWAGSLSSITISDAINLFGDDLSEKQLKQLEERLNGGGGYYGLPTKEMKYHVDKTLENLYFRNVDMVGITSDHGLHGTSYKLNSNLYNELIPLVHMEWKWMRKIGFLTYTDPTTFQEVKVMVDEIYEHPKDAIKVKYVNKFGRSTYFYEWIDELGNKASIEYMHIPDVWEGYRLDNDIYFGIQRKPNQYINPENPFNVKLGYYGRRFNAVNANSISIMGRMKPYQFLYFLFMHQLGELASKNDGPIKNIDLSMIDPALGDGDPKIAVEKTLWYFKKGFNLYNSLANSNGGPIASRPNPTDISNASSTQDMLNLIQIIDWLGRLIGLSAGISPQRASEFSSNTNVTDNQQAISQSSHITEKYFNQHNKLWSEIMSDYINMYRKWASNYLKTTNATEHYLQYILPDQTIEALKITPEMLDNADVGAFIVSSGSDWQYGEKMEQLTMALIQNDQATIEDVSNIVKMRVSGASPEEIDKKLKESKAKRDAREMEMSKQQEEIRLKQTKELNDAQMKQFEMQKDLIVIKAQEDRLTKMMTNQNDNDGNDNGISDMVDLAKLKLEERKMQLANELELKKLQQEKELKEKEMQVKKLAANRKNS